MRSVPWAGVGGGRSMPTTRSCGIHLISMNFEYYMLFTKCSKRAIHQKTPQKNTEKTLKCPMSLCQLWRDLACSVPHLERISHGMGIRNFPPKSENSVQTLRELTAVLIKIKISLLTHDTATIGLKRLVKGHTSCCPKHSNTPFQRPAESSHRSSEQNTDHPN